MCCSSAAVQPAPFWQTVSAKTARAASCFWRLDRLIRRTSTRRTWPMLILLVVWRDMTGYVGAGIDARSISLGRCQSAWGPPDRTALDTDWPRLYYSGMNDSVATALIHAAQRVEERLEKVLAGVGLSCAKFGALGVLVGQDQPISLSELAEKLTCVRSNVTQLVDRLEADGLAKRIDLPVDRRAVRAEVTALGRERHATGATVVNAVLQDVAKELSAIDPQVLKRALDAIQ